MEMNRREFLAAGAAVAAAAAAPRALAQWQPSPRYPDPAIQVIDQSFARYRLALARVEQIATGMRWCEGPVWFGDGALSALERHPEQPHPALGRGDRRGDHLPQAGRLRERQHPRPAGPAPHLRARQAARLAHRVRRHDHDRGGQVRRQAAQLAERHRVQVGRLDLVHRSAVRRPRLLRRLHREARAADQRLPRGSAATASSRVVAGDVNRPNGLAFSPDESKLYIIEAGTTPRNILVYDVAGGGTQLTNKRQLIDAGPGTPDGMKCDVDGNLWVGWGMGQESARRRGDLQSRRQADRPHRPARALREPLLRRRPTATGSSCAAAPGCTRCT